MLRVKLPQPVGFTIPVVSPTCRVYYRQCCSTPKHTNAPNTFASLWRFSFPSGRRRQICSSTRCDVYLVHPQQGPAVPLCLVHRLPLLSVWSHLSPPTRSTSWPVACLVPPIIWQEKNNEKNGSTFCFWLFAQHTRAFFSQRVSCSHAGRRDERKLEVIVALAFVVDLLIRWA